MALLIATTMMVSNIAPAFASDETTSDDKYEYNYQNLAKDKDKIINEKTPVNIARPEKSEEYVKEAPLPAIYTLRTDYKAEKGEKYSVNYQPYVASVGANANKEEQAKVNKKIDLPDMAGYEKPRWTRSFKNDYKKIVDKAKDGNKTYDNGDRYLALDEYKYTAMQNTVLVKHVFQNMEDFNKFTNKDGTITKNDGTVIDEEGRVTKYDLKDKEQKEKYQAFVRDHETISKLNGNTGSTLEVQALPENERPGFEPQVTKLKTQIPEDTSDFKIEYRYNRAAYDVVFDTVDGTPLPTRTYYYDQEIPKIDENSIPTKEGCEFQGWKPSHDLVDADGNKYKKGEIIKDAKGNTIVDLGNTFYKKDGSGKYIVKNGDPVKGNNQKEIKLKMPALKLGDGKYIPREKLTFTAVWKDKEKADYAVQFWVEKADHADGASILEKYEYMSTRVYKQQDTGKRPELDKEPVNGLKFPDLDQARLNKIWKGDKFNRGSTPYINKFFVYNKDLTDKENADPKQPTITKAVSATGKTVYNIYYDRQVYDLYFTKSNALSDKETFYPEIWGRDQKKNELVKLGGPGNLYHYKARFNEMMYKWPNDAMQTKGFTEGYQSFGWGPNYDSPKWPVHLDTPPYRLNADQFLDMANYNNLGGYTKHIDKGDGTNIDLDPLDFKTLSFGIKQEKPSIPHHMDFWMDGFKDGETIIRYDLVRTKADTADPGYTHKYPIVTGFTPYGQYIQEESQEDGRVNEDRIDELNDEREEITPYPGNGKAYYNIFGINSHVGELKFIPAFFSNADEFGDPLGGEESGFKENGYLQFHYKRNKYPLRFNYDPTKIKADTEFFYPNENGSEAEKNKANALETFYEFPLKCLSPDVDDNDEYKKLDDGKNPANLLDNPNNLYKLGLYDLLQRDKNDPSKFFQDKKGNYRVKRPEGLSDQMVFKGWALDPAGNKMVWKNPKETMPFHPLNLYAIWDEPDYKWKVTIDPNGGELNEIGLEDLTTEKKTIKEGDIGQEEEKTYPVAGYENETAKDGTQIFTVVQKQKLNKLPKPTRYGYDFLGWEVIRYTKDKDGNYTNIIDNSYRNRYKVPELYSFGTDVVAPIYLKAIWVENKRAEVKVYHYYLKNQKTDKDEKLVLDTSKYPNPEPNSLSYKRVDDYVPATGEKQDEHWILASNTELMKKLHGTYKENGKEVDLKQEYEKYNERVKLNNTYFQTFRVKDNINVGTEDNPVYKPNPENVFRFYYRPFRTRNYKVNYLDEKGRAEVDKFFSDLKLTDTQNLTGDKLLEANTKNKETFEAKRADLEKILDQYKIIDKEEVTSNCRHYDARNYRHIPGWTLASDPQQQLFYDVNENTHEFLGINGTGSDEIYFYYKDARVIEVKNPKDPTPKGYVRVIFKADKGGSFGKDKDGKDIKELYYDVIKGLKSDLLPVPKELAEGETVDKDKYYITPETGKKFVKWDKSPLLNKDTIINEDHTFTAYFEWSGLSASGLVRTEAFKDPNGKWTNNFAPTIDQLKAQLVWREKDQVKDLPAGTEIKLYDEAGNELTTDDQVFELVNEKKALDKDELVRKVNIKAKVTFKDGKDPQELDIPITVYKNVYEALNKAGDKPLFLKEAEGKEAKDGGLSDVTGNYVKVTVKASKDFNDKDDKIYYVNKNAWVEIPEVKTDGSSTFINWTADRVAQNENGIFDFTKRHKFIEDTVISPSDAKDVVEQTDPNKKPDVPDSYVKVIVETTDKATDETTFKKTFWVNPTKEVTIDVTNPTGKTDQDVTIPIFGRKKASYDFKKWQIVQTGEADDKLQKVEPTKIDIAKHRYTDKVTVIEASYSQKIAWFDILKPTETKELHTPQGKEITNDDLIKQITPQEDKEIESIDVISTPNPNTVGKSEAKVIIKYKDGTTQGTNDNPIVIPVEVHEPILEAGPKGQKPKEALDNYVKVIFKAGTGGKLGNTLSGSFTYYVSPEVEVDMTETAGNIIKIPDVGYISGDWDTSETKKLKDKFTPKETEFTFNFTKTKDIVEKTDDNVKKPDGYVKVSFISKDGNMGKLEGDKLEKIYYVNPKADIKLVELADGQKAKDNQLAVPKTKPSANYVFDRWYEDINTKDSITSERKYEARFKLDELTLTYKAGEGAKGTVPEAITVDYGKSVRLARPDGLTKENATFAGWKLDGEEKIYQAGDLVKLEKARTATAQWKPVEHTVTFDSNGGSKIDDQKVKHNDKLKAFAEPKQEGKVFMGWKEKDKEDKESYFDLTSPITEDKNLVAIWQDPVQEIKDGDKIEDKFIKVSFKKGSHGKLDPGEKTYKIAKNYSFEKAKEKGMEVPTIKADKYYKAKDGESAWDKKLELKGQSIEFTAQYELMGDVIPVDKADRDDDEIKQEQPEGTVLVEYKVANTDKAYLDGAYKFFVKKGKEVTIRSPLFVKTDKDYDFKGWTSGNPDDQANEEEKNKWEQVAKKDGEEKVYIRGIFVKDEIIINQNEDKPFIEIFKANAGDKYVEINELSEGAEGRLSIVRSDVEGNEVETEYESGIKTFKVRRRRKLVEIKKKVFDFKGDSLQSGDIIRFKAVKVKDGEITSESDVTEIVID
ncbi:InlB B-repeat-containing protein [Anaerococcus tetradius]|uniref:Repeat protein n=1 Tax=Anaerococcus tetradius ATCC 35098 TaxID=525255 RepID=C2CKK6_9FIRM|nr:repeat protein [Anaerococcus tetradius ATCC 35098]